MAVTVTPIRVNRLGFWIVGTSPLIQHKWSEKAIREMRDKQGGKKTRTREPKDPAVEAESATYRTAEGDYGIPIMAFKKALITAAHKDIGIEKTLVRKALFFPCTDPDMVIPMECSEPVGREDLVRVGAGTADLRYRPEFRTWRARIEVDMDSDLLTVEDLVNLANRAGFGVGIGEWRPEKGGEYGRFQVDMSEPVENRHGV